MQLKLKPIVAALAALSICPLTAFAAEKDMDPIVVTATRQASRVSEVLGDVTVIEKDEIERAGPVTSIAEFLATQPGVQYKSNGSIGSTADIVLRGGASATHTLVLIDGIRSIPGNGGFTWQAVPLSQIERIEILRGPASSLYGNDAIGGVVHIFTKRGDGPMQFSAEMGAGSQNTTSVKAGVSGKSKALRYSLQIADIGTDGINATTRPHSSYNPDKDGYTNQSLSGSLSYALSRDTEIGTQILQANSRTDYDGGFTPTSRLSDYRSNTNLQSVSNYLTTRVSPNWKTTFRVGQNINTYKTFRDHLKTYEFQTTQEQYIWQNDIKTSIGNWMLAAEHTNQAISSDLTYPVTQRKVDSYVAGWTGNFGNHLVQLSGRHDMNTQFGNKTTGNAAYGYQINSNWRASASYGTAFRAPTFINLYYPQSCATYAPGCWSNPTLRPESSTNREAAISYEKGLQKVRVSAFANSITDLIALNSNWYPVNATSAQIQGVTTDFSQQFGRFNFAANYTQQQAKNKETQLTLQNQADRYGSLRLSYQHSEYSWLVEGVGVGRRFANGNNQYEMGGYGLINLQASYQLHKEWSAFARINNLFDRPYELTQYYNAIGTNVFIGLRYTPK